MGTGTPLPLDPREMQTARADIKREFPNLDDSFQVTSWPGEHYNCIAWAAEDAWRWWWPDIDSEAFWPHGLDRDETIPGFVAAFATLGYAPCISHELEVGYEKVVIFAIGTRVKHMSRQLPSGAWTSKLGDWWDIGHSEVDEVRATHYGRRIQILRRLIPEAPVVVPSGS
jgi:hypothetical protein